MGPIPYGNRIPRGVRKTPRSISVIGPVAGIVMLPIVATNRTDYKGIVNVTYSTEQYAKQPRRWARGARVGLAEAFDLSEIPEKRKHLYVYSVLLLLTLLAHTIRTSYHAPARSAVNAQVAKFMEITDVARNLY